VRHAPPAPPFSLAPPTFAFPALAAQAGRAALGGARETVLACLMGARLVVGALEGGIGLEARAARAVAAKSWLASLALPATVRPPLVRLFESSGSAPRDELATLLRSVTVVTAQYLDQGARLELESLVGSLADGTG
jgi:hypothetical protein